MDRREFFLHARPDAAALALAAPTGRRDESGEPDDGAAIRGVGVLRFPGDDPRIRKVAQEVASEIRQGTILALPDTRDKRGNYLWDFRIEGGDPAQVQVERHGGEVA